MTNFVASLLTRASACNARVAAMQAANESRKDRGLAPAYDEQSFQEEAGYLERLADEMRNASDQ